MAFMEINVVPLGTGTTSFSGFVVLMKKALEETGVNHTLTDMGTIIEADIKTLLGIAGKLHEIPFSSGERRVYTVIKIDDRRDTTTSLGEKVKSVMEKI